MRQDKNEGMEGDREEEDVNCKGGVLLKGEKGGWGRICIVVRGLKGMSQNGTSFDF